MSQACPIAAPDAPAVQALLTGADCHLDNLVHAGYAALFASGGDYAALMGTAAVIAVVVIGYRLMLGLGGARLSNFILLVVKLGVVIALASQWPAYQTVIYRALSVGPLQVANAVLSRFGDRQPSEQVLERLQAAVDILSAARPEAPTTVGQATQQAAMPGATAAGAPPTPQTAGSPPPALPASTPDGASSRPLKSAATTLMLATLGPILAAKATLALLLALGPLFIVCLLFEQTMGLFLGWARACAAAALTPLAGILTTALGLTMLEPWLTALSAPDLSTGSPHVEQIVVVLIGLVVLMATASIIAMAAIGGGLGIRGPLAAQAADPIAGLEHREAAEGAMSRLLQGLTGRAAAQTGSRDEAQGGERRIAVGRSRGLPSARDPAVSAPASVKRLGQDARRGLAPRTGRVANARNRR